MAGRPATRAIPDLRTYRKRFVTPIQLAEYVGVTRRTIYTHIEKGALPAKKIGGVIRIPTSAAREYADTPVAISV
jgi:excisionase family DNA binding protein